MSLEFQPHVELTGSAERPLAGGSPPMRRAGLVIGEWSLDGAAWTDRHEHDEITILLDGELRVSTDDESVTLRPGDRVAVPAGSRARYEATGYARMLYVYGPSTDGHAMFDGAYEELRASSPSRNRSSAAG